MTDFIENTPSGALHARFVFAHGAGAPMDSPFMNAVAEGLAAHGILVTRFEFPYMARRRTLGKGGGPGSPAALEQCWRDVIAELSGPLPLFIGGKSMGGRIASLVAGDGGVAGLICFGYPFHPPGRPEKLRTSHLRSVPVPALIVQGTRDPFGGPDEVAGYGLDPKIEVCWIPDGDHSFKPRKRSGYTEGGNLETAIGAAAKFVAKVI